MKGFLTILVLLFSLNIYAQTDSDTTVEDSIPKVMIIPFNPDLYFSDSDHSLAEFNKMTAGKVREMFRRGLDFDLNVRVMTRYDTKQILRDTARNVQEDLLAIYEGISYRFEPIPGNDDIVKKKLKLLKRFESKVKEIDHPGAETEAMTKSSKVVEETDRKKYMNVIPYNKEMFTYLHEKYETDLYLFINQFELKTNYERCLDRVNNVFEREVSVHYSIFNRFGDQLKGGVVTVGFPSNSNDIDQIIRSNFPLISEQLIKEIN